MPVLQEKRNQKQVLSLCLRLMVSNAAPHHETSSEFFDMLDRDIDGCIDPVAVPAPVRHLPGAWGRSGGGGQRWDSRKWF